ncbi:MAG TPA: SLC13 family permease [Woeseiaceae bacterium]|jgi:GntP family gluconate:H+ symporter|nr:SLC13 family permease [Woeseiaceae bacterium]
MSTWYPFAVLAVGLVVVVGGIIVLRLHAFLSLIAAALVVSLLAPGDWAEKVPRVAEAFGDTAAGIGIIIALAAIIGMAMAASGAADRVVELFLRLFGRERGAGALSASGFTLAIPVFFDTVFFLLVPLVRSMYRRSGRHYVRYLIAAATCASAHALVPPTPGPLLVADTLGVEVGTMMIVGLAVGLPAALAGLAFAAWTDRRMAVAAPDHQLPAQPAAARALPGAIWSLAPIVLPVALITCGNVLRAAGLDGGADGAGGSWLRLFQVLGTPDLALLLAAAVALLTWWRQRRPDRETLSEGIGDALMTGGVIVLITCAGGAFGAALRMAELAPAIRALTGDSAAAGVGVLFLGFGVTALLKFAQGSSTAAMIVASAMLAAMLDTSGVGFHRVYVATAIGSGSLVGSWMNDSGFWIFARMGGLTERQTLGTWTPLLALMGLVGMAVTLLLVSLFPMA